MRSNVIGRGMEILLAVLLGLLLLFIPEYAEAADGNEEPGDGETGFYLDTMEIEVPAFDDRWMDLEVFQMPEIREIFFSDDRTFWENPELKKQVYEDIRSGFLQDDFQMTGYDAWDDEELFSEERISGLLEDSEEARQLFSQDIESGNNGHFSLSLTPLYRIHMNGAELENERIARMDFDWDLLLEIRFVYWNEKGEMKSAVLSEDEVTLTGQQKITIPLSEMFYRERGLKLSLKKETVGIVYREYNPRENLLSVNSKRDRISFQSAYGFTHIVLNSLDPSAVVDVGIEDFRTLDLGLESLRKIYEKDVLVLKDVSEPELYGILPCGTQFDLNGHEIKVAAFIVFDSELRDSSCPESLGKIVAPKDYLIYNMNTSDFLPAYDADEGAYHLYEIVAWYERWSEWVNPDRQELTFSFRPYTETNLVETWQKIFKPGSGVTAGIQFEFETESNINRYTYVFDEELYAPFSAKRTSSFQLTFLTLDRYNKMTARGFLNSQVYAIAGPASIERKKT